MKLIATILLLISVISSLDHRRSHRNITAPGSDSITIIPNSDNVKTVRQLCRKFTGKPLFIDLWASWCGACIEEFRFGTGFSKWLKNNGITTIYVSYDNSENFDVWNKDIIRYNLTGYHIIANQSLRDDFSKMIWGAPGGVSLPHYLIVDSRGNVIEKGAHNLSTGDQLKQQVLQDLKLK